jgi:ribulose-phosphate 3-epimerase
MHVARRGLFILIYLNMMIIPAINCQTFEQVTERMRLAQEILLSDSAKKIGGEPHWIHIDVADGSFTAGYQTWREAKQLSELVRHSNVRIEIHLMTTRPQEMTQQWLAVGVHRLIVHADLPLNFRALIDECHTHKAEIFLAIKPETSIDVFTPFLAMVDGFQFLAVEPGLSGQRFDIGTPDKIVALRQLVPTLPIEVDGGVTPETAQLCLFAGASQLVSSSYIFSNKKPLEAYQQLATIPAYQSSA